MKKVRFLDEPKESKEPKPIEFTHYLDSYEGWKKTSDKPSQYSDIVYLGKCKIDGDMFCAKITCGSISIYKGHLNDGVY